VSFPGYTVSIIPSVDDLFHLVRDWLMWSRSTNSVISIVESIPSLP
jgi:hypothetical protein